MGNESKVQPIENIPPYKKLPLADNFMFGAVMRQEKMCRLFLEPLLDTKIERIEFINKEMDLSDSASAHGIRLDIFLADGKGTRYNIEMQQFPRNGLERRVRYYQSAIDRNIMEKGASYKELPDAYIIFVCDFDYFGHGYACYETTSCLNGDMSIPYKDGSHAIFLNCEYAESGDANQDILEFLDYIRAKDDDFDAHSELVKTAKALLEEVRKDSEKEELYMTWAMSIRDAEERGSDITTVKHILAFADAHSPEELARRLGVSIEYVQAVLKGTKKA